MSSPTVHKNVVPSSQALHLHQSFLLGAQPKNPNTTHQSTTPRCFKLGAKKKRPLSNKISLCMCCMLLRHSRQGNWVVEEGNHTSSKRAQCGGEMERGRGALHCASLSSAASSEQYDLQERGGYQLMCPKKTANGLFDINGNQTLRQFVLAQSKHVYLPHRPSANVSYICEAFSKLSRTTLLL